MIDGTEYPICYLLKIYALCSFVSCCVYPVCLSVSTCSVCEPCLHTVDVPWHCLIVTDKFQSQNSFLFCLHVNWPPSIIVYMLNCTTAFMLRNAPEFRDSISNCLVLFRLYCYCIYRCSLVLTKLLNITICRRGNDIYFHSLFLSGVLFKPAIHTINNSWGILGPLK